LQSFNHPSRSPISVFSRPTFFFFFCKLNTFILELVNHRFKMVSTSPLLALPRELRDTIYEDTVLSSPIYLSRRITAMDHGRRFATRSAFSLVSRQVHVEYNETLDHIALSAHFPNATIEVPITDLDFRNLITFTHFLQPHERTALRSTQLKIKLAFDRVKDASELMNGLAEWADHWFGLGVTARYEYDERSSVSIRYIWPKVGFWIRMAVEDDWEWKTEMDKVNRVMGKARKREVARVGMMEAVRRPAV